ncbi:hypothetical protein HK101_002626 [Irineochytrium annulatum]|nr:hypothetical protein HK101_002626 [Irineochytrium annulatum]
MRSVTSLVLLLWAALLAPVLLLTPSASADPSPRAAVDDETMNIFSVVADNFKTNIEKHFKGDVDGEGKTRDVYYFFLVTDTNGDAHLDGSELMHSLAEYEDIHAKKERISRPTLREVERLVDRILMNEDVDNDGMISWGEFLEALSKY